MILFDLLSAQPSGDTKYHGGGEYIKSVFKALLEKSSSQEIAVCFDSKEYLDQWLLDLLSEKKVCQYQVSNWDDIRRLLDTGKFDKFFSGLPRQISRNPSAHSFEYIGTIHGLRPIEKPFDKYMVPLTKGVIEKVKAIGKSIFQKKVTHEYAERIKSLDIVLTDSLHSKYAIENTFGYCDAKVIYPPLKQRKMLADTTSKPQEKYILLVSCNRWEKNPVRAVRALDGLFDKGCLKDFRVVCLGATQGLDAFRLHNPDRFLAKGYVDANELESLYRDCDLFFYPTLNEGFGYPPLEALSYGKTCVVSSVCSIPEICGNAVYYVNPYDQGEMQARLLEASERKIDGLVIERQLEKIERIQQHHLKLLISLLLG